MKKITLAIFLFAILASKMYAQAPKDFNTAALKYADKQGIKKNGLRNLYMKGDVIHVFVAEDGNLLLSGYPTTATDKNRFQFHLFKSDNTGNYRFEANGNYEPTLNIDKEGKDARSLTEGRDTAIVIDFTEVGPYTGTVAFAIKKINGGESETITSANVKIAKTIHASIGTGFVFSTLKDPTNIKKVPLGNSVSDSTLMADNAHGGTSLAIMATVYPWGRNSLMLNSNSLKDRLGIVFGTRIASDAKNFQNLYLGAQIDFAVGGSVVFGIDIASRQKLRGLNNFKYGETVFTGKPEDRLFKETGVGLFFGVQIDSRIFAKMFTP